MKIARHFSIFSLAWFTAITFTVSSASAWSAVAKATQLDHPHVSLVRNFYRHANRTMITPRIAHYTLEVQVGPGQFDRVRIHRVVKERRPHRPVRTKDGVFLLPGASNSVEGIFLPTADHSFARFLAERGIDVWAMDYGWALVLVETMSFEFMQGWGVERDARDTRIALTIARLIRGFTRQGFGRINLLGFSYGGVVGYAVAGEETQLPWYRRNVKALVPVDQWIKFEEDANRLIACDNASGLQALVDAGQFQNDQGVQFSVLATLAKAEPDNPSPAIPGLTNRQAILLVTAATFATTVREPFWHFFGGIFDDAGLPRDLNFSDLGSVLDFAVGLPPYLPNQALLDVWDSACDEKDVPFDDHLGEIRLPILYVGAGGGTGSFGEFTTGLTWSSDINSVVVQIFPDDQRFRDYGHGDLWFARDAQNQVWQPILGWLRERSRRSH